MKIIYFGSNSDLSFIPLNHLLQSHHTVSAVVVNNDSAAGLNTISPNTIKALALSKSIPIHHFNAGSSEFIAQLGSLQADIIIVSCFARRLPKEILLLAKFGGINIHPSLLPRFRGPDPLFWQFRDGVDEFAVSIHQITNELDAGDIFLQEKVMLDEGLSHNDARRQLAEVAGTMLINILPEFEKGTVSKIKQDEFLASYQPFPEQRDYCIDTSWKIKRVFNFINAYKAPAIYFLANIYGKKVKLTSAISYQENQYEGMGSEMVVYKENTVMFACQDGFVKCEYVD